jgi:hypothetical protein
MDLGTAVNDIGRLIGVLTAGDSGVELNGAWFGDPVGALEAAQTRLNALADLLGAVLGPAASGAPDVFPGACWYNVPNPVSLTPTVFHLVASPGSDAAGQIGGGVLWQVAMGDVTVSAYGYFPLFTYDGSGATLVATTAPCRIGLYATTPGGFSVGGVSFTAVDLDASLYFSGATPTFSLTFEGLAGTTEPATYTSLAALTAAGGPEAWLADVVVAGQSWLDTYLSGYVTIGQLLTAAGYLDAQTTTDPDSGSTVTTYTLDLSQLSGKTPEEIALGFVFQTLDALAAVDFPLISLPGGGLFVAYDAGTETYGVRLQAQVSLSGGGTGAPAGGGTTVSGGGSGSGSTAPPALQVELALGTWMTGETDAANWVTSTGAAAVPGGVTLNLLQGDAQGVAFAPSLVLSSVGVNVSGGGGTPLVSVDGVTLGGAELRASYDPATGAYGFAARLDQVGVPLAPAFPGGSGGNPVAQNLLASGSDPASAGQASATAPTFSMQAAYVAGQTPAFELIDATGTVGGTVWFPVQQRFGPVSCQKIGVRFDTSGSPLLDLIFDGGVELGGLSVYLDQLSVGIPLAQVDDLSAYSLDLQGMDVSFTAPGIEISGGLLKTVPQGGGVEYDGQALLKAGGLAINALGSYATLPGGGTSLFVFAWLNEPLGGPACFYVTGLAAGFGYNRALKIPAMSEVQTFPLVAGLSNPSLLGGGAPTPAAALTAIESWVPPERGEYFVAAGVQFTTFDVVNTNALVVVEFGQQLTVAVLGISTLKQPQAGPTWVYAELDIEAVVQPDQGVFQASAVLAPGSYVITPDAHLTGGFAFYAWWDPSIHAGDFVFTLGGYHPAFNPREWYPQVPRLGINWQFDSSTSLVGGAYFALTPAAMMAGADLQLTYSDGNLKAWLKAQCDAILFWKPFYLIATASISVGVSYRISVLGISKTLSVEIGADFELWGPPVGFKVHVDWYVISFTIGSRSPNPPTAITWDDFKGMLPSKTTQTSSGASTSGGSDALPQGDATTAASTVAAGGTRVPLSTPTGAPQSASGASASISLADSSAVAAEAGEPADDGTTTTPAYLTITVNSGLKSQQTVEGLTLWLVRAGQFSCTVASAVAATQVVVQSGGETPAVTITGGPVALRNVNGGIPASDYQSTQTVAIVQLSSTSAAHIEACMATSQPCSADPAGCTDPLEDLAGWEVDGVVRPLPQGMWGDPVPAGQDPDINGTPTVSGTVGVALQPLAPVIGGCTPQMVIDTVFADRTVNPGDQYALPVSAAQVPCPATPAAADSFAQIAQVNDPATAAERSALFDALTLLGVSGWTNDPLPLMAAAPGQDFADEPLEGTPVCASA